MNAKKKRLLVILVATLAIVVSGGWMAMSSFHSGPNSHMGHRPEISRSHGMAAILGQRLGLDADQQPKVDKIAASVEEQMKALQREKRSPEEQKAKMQTIFNEASGEIKKVLRPDQEARFEEIRKEMSSAHGH